jgi:Transposase DDE domain
MFLRSQVRKKDGQEHTYWSVVENKRLPDGRVAQRQVLYLGEVNDSQRAAWRKTLDAHSPDSDATAQIALFPHDRPAPEDDARVVRIHLDQLSLHHPRPWGGCWLALELYRQLGLDTFFAAQLPVSRKGTRWDQILQVLVTQRLLAPGSEWQLHRDWFERTALADLLGGDFGLAEIHKLYATLDQVLPLKEKLFAHLRDKWSDLFGAKYEVLLYDLTSTYFETNTPEDPADPRRHGYSRDHRPDCPQVVIALVVTPEGFPLAYEILPGNTADNTTLQGFLEKIQARYGQAQRVWLMDRGIPTEAVLTQMRASDPPVNYLVGTPKGALTALEKALLQRPWETVRDGVQVKLLPQDGEVYVLARSVGRVGKERAIRRKKLRRLLARLHELRKQSPGRDKLLMALGAAKKEAGRFYTLLKITVPAADQVVSAETFSFRCDRPRLRVVRRREGRYLLRSNLTGRPPAEWWTFYTQLVQVEEAFKNLKGDLRVRPVYHQKLERIEAHILVAFLAYSLHVCLRQRLKAVAGGLTSRAVLEKFCTVQMVDVHLPTTDGRTVILTRHTQPEKELQVLLEQLNLTLPAQPPPKITAAAALAL